MSNPWQEWKKKNLERQLNGDVSPLDFINPDTEYASDKDAVTRLSICENCPLLLATKQCSECLCFMPVKVRLLHASCPKGYW